jgi:hypothetical protein
MSLADLLDADVAVIPGLLDPDGLGRAELLDFAHIALRKGSVTCCRRKGE